MAAANAALASATASATRRSAATVDRLERYPADPAARAGAPHQGKVGPPQLPVLVVSIRALGMRQK